MPVVLRLNIGLLLVIGVQSVSAAAGFDGDAEHWKVTRKPVSILTGIGSIDFRITCELPHTQQYFNQGIALLHGNEFRLADRSFFHASTLEPSCPMVWLGLAFANEANLQLAAFSARKALQLQDAAADREKLWITAWNAYFDPATSETDRRNSLVTALDRIMTQYPDDPEAGAFLARQLIRNREAGIPLPFTSTADLLIEHILRQNCDHPAHHYKLQLWEQSYPERALNSAEHVQRQLPSLARIQTAAGRVYSRLGRRNDALARFEAAMAVGCRRTQLESSFPTEIDGFVENAGLMIDHLAMAGRVREVVMLSRRLIEMPNPELPAPVKTESVWAGFGARTVVIQPPVSPDLIPATVGQQKLLEILVDYQRWEQLLALDDAGYFESSDRAIQIRRIHAVGWAHFGRRDPDAIATQTEKLEQLRANLPEAASGGANSTLAAQIDAAVGELQLCESVARHREPPATLPEIPSQRMAAIFLSAADPVVAEKLVRETVMRSRRADHHLQLVRTLISGNKPDEAGEFLKELKQQFPRIDADLLSGLERVTSAEGTVAIAPTFAAVSHEFLKVPVAPAFKLFDRHEKLLTTEDVQGKRLVLVFYLGAGCPHCIEQLQTFTPLKEEFEQAGLTVIAISTDSVAGLQKTFEVAGAGEAIPFKLVSDESLTAFRSFSAIDPRDSSPLHGTFLIDPQGRIVWNNVRREPFMATKSLLEEARRVFALKTVDFDSPQLGGPAE